MVHPGYVDHARIRKPAVVTHPRAICGPGRNLSNRLRNGVGHFPPFANRLQVCTGMISDCPNAMLALNYAARFAAKLPAGRVAGFGGQAAMLLVPRVAAALLFRPAGTVRWVLGGWMSQPVL